MKLSIEDRRQLLNWIMKDAKRSGDEAVEAFIKSNPSISREYLEDEVMYVWFNVGAARMYELMRVHGYPIRRYDSKSDRVYQEYLDGRKKYIDEIEPKDPPNSKE